MNPVKPSYIPRMIPFLHDSPQSQVVAASKSRGPLLVIRQLPVFSSGQQGMKECILRVFLYSLNPKPGFPIIK